MLLNLVGAPPLPPGGRCGGVVGGGSETLSPGASGPLGPPRVLQAKEVCGVSRFGGDGKCIWSAFRGAVVELSE